jgi:hypothetical protein
MSNQFPDTEWNLFNDKGEIGTWEKVGIAVLMDIRRELRTLNTVLRCPHFVAIPRKLDRIAKNTAKKKKKAVR